MASRSKTAEDLPGKLGIFDTFGGAVQAEKSQVGYGRKEIVIFSSPFVRIPTPDHSLKLDGGRKRGRTLRPVIRYLSTNRIQAEERNASKTVVFARCVKYE